MSTLKATNIKNESSASNNIVLDSGGGVVVSGILTATTFSGDGSSLTGIDATQIVTGNTSVQTVDTGSDGHVKINTEGTERARIDSSGRLLVGIGTARTNIDFYGTALTPTSQIEGTSNNTSSVALISNSATDNVSSQLHFCKSGTDGVGNNGAVVNNEILGRISFSGNDGTNFLSGAEILCAVDATPGTNDMPARLSFRTTSDSASSSSERMTITSRDITFVRPISIENWASNMTGNLTVTGAGGSPEQALSVAIMNNSFTTSVIRASCESTAASSWNFMTLLSGRRYDASSGGDVEFQLRGDGQAYADQSWNGGGADYAEYFEWSDGNTTAEDRRGISVVLDGDKIREAVAGEDPIGVISGNPSVVGDAAWNNWTEKHLKDDFGSYIWEDHNVVEWTDEEGVQQSYEDWTIPEGVIVPDDATIKTHDENGKKLQHRKLNPAFDPDAEYIPREQRPEWDAVGLMGKLRIRKGQVTGSRWIKMRDISDTVEEWLVR